MNMNRKQLVERIAHDTEMSKAGGEVTLVGFGTFSVKTRAERAGRHPQNGEPIIIAAAKKASFKPGKELNARLVS